MNQLFNVNYNKCIVCTWYFRTDDIQDNSVLRRGIPVAHSIYGIASTINAANYMSFVALERTLSLGHPMVDNQLFYSSIVT